MWKLGHALFGWQYVHMRNTATEIIRRVQTSPAGDRYVRYFSSDLVFLDKPHGWEVTPLTRK
jgi:hypothetical protein